MAIVPQAVGDGIPQVVVLRKLFGDFLSVANIPVWIRDGEDGNLHAKLALFDIETSGTDKADLDAALWEALILFARNADEHGQGFEKELMDMGWAMAKKKERRRKLVVDPSDIPVMPKEFKMSESLTREYAQ
jgi:hypothetical protein